MNYAKVHYCYPITVCLVSHAHKDEIFINTQVLHGTYEMLPTKIKE